MKRTLFLIFSVAGLVLLATWLIWPTPYLYQTHEGQFYRVNRWTGVKQRATDGGWMTDDEEFRAALRDIDVRAEQTKIRLVSAAQHGLIESAGFNGYQLDLRYKDGSTSMEQLPIHVAQSVLKELAANHVMVTVPMAVR